MQEEPLEQFIQDGSVLRFSLQHDGKAQQFEMLYLDVETDEELEEAARSSDPRKRFAAVYRMAQSPKERYLNALLEAAGDRGFAGRGAAVIGLAKLAGKSRAARRAVIAALFSADYLLTLSALQGMGFLRGFWNRRRLWRVLRHLMRQPLDATPASTARAFLAIAAAESLIRCGDHRAATQLHQLLEHPDTVVKTHALTVIARHPELADMEKINSFRKQPPPVSIPALEVLAKRGENGALEELLAYAESPDGGVRAQAAAAILRIGSKDALNAAQKLLHSEQDPLLKTQIAARLLAAGKQVAPSLMEPLLSDSSPLVRQGAMLVLLKTEKGKQILKEHLRREPDEILRRLIEKGLEGGK